MTLKEFQTHFKEELKGIYPPNELDSILSIVLEDLLALTRVQVIMEQDKVIDGVIEKSLIDITERLQNSEPVQYILGKTQFYDLDLKIGPAVLIPRPETEELVRWILDSVQHSTLSILDIGTGSGCIPLALKSNLPQAHVTGVDISKYALEIARLNAKNLGLEVEFVKRDILSEEEPISGIFDIIVSNPPYVTQDESDLMKKNVLNYEPHAALFVPNSDPLLFYRRIAELGRLHLNKSGLLFFEINERFGKDVSDLLREMEYSDVTLRKDLNGKDRMIKATFI